jgi:hypothetical protein
VFMLAGWGVGWWAGRRRAARGDAMPESKLGDAIMALLGLLLGFTFSMALGKHDQRRQMLVTDSNAIGDFYTCASLVSAPVRGKLQGVIRAYVEHRIANVTADEAGLVKALDEAERMQSQMQMLAQEAVEGGTPVAVPLVNTLNGLTSSHAARLAAVRDRLPFSVVALLFLSAIVSTLLVGMQQGAAGQRPLAPTLGFIVLVSMVVGVTLDLNQPQRGMIRVSQEPLQRLLSGMGK